MAATPSPPTNFTGSPAHGQVTLTWTPSAKTTVNIYRAIDPSGSFTLLVSGLTQTYWVDQGLADGSSYSYYVTSVDNAGNESSHSPTLSLPAPRITFNYITEHGQVHDLDALINTWNGSPYQLLAIYNPSNADACWCVWGKTLVQTAT